MLTVLVAACAVSTPVLVPAHDGWRYTKDGAARPAPPGGWFDGATVGAAVVRQMADQSWRMYYAGRPLDFAEDIIPIATGYVGLAVSDDGLRWRRVACDAPLGSCLGPSEASSGAFDASHVGVGDVVIGGPSPTYRMLYFGGDQRMPQLGANSLPRGASMAIGAATSSDGVQWQREPGPLASGALIEPSGSQLFVGWPQLLTVAPSEHRLYYHAMTDGRFVICVATSPDLVAWTPHGQCFAPADIDDAFDDGSVSARCVLPDPSCPGSFLMFYEAQDRQRRHTIGLARSTDGLAWERGKTPVFVPTGGDAWDGAAVSRPWVVPLEDGTARLYYLGRSQAGAHAIGVAESRGTDWSAWDRVSAPDPETESEKV